MEHEGNMKVLDLNRIMDRLEEVLQAGGWGAHNRTEMLRTVEAVVLETHPEVKAVPEEVLDVIVLAMLRALAAPGDFSVIVSHTEEGSSVMDATTPPGVTLQ